MRCPAFLLLLLLGVTSYPARAAPPLTDQQQQNLRDTATDRDANLDQGPALYELLTSAADWRPDDFTGERGAAAPPTPDYAYLADHPDEVRGDLFFIEGRFVEQVRYPTAERDGRDHLARAGHPVWGDQLTAWGIQVGDDRDDVVMVYFVDPGAAITPPAEGQRVRVAARFYKVWSVPDRDGRPLDFLTFVGGARETVGNASGAGGGVPGYVTPLLIVIAAAGAYYGVRLLLVKKSRAQRARSEAQREQRHRNRAYDEDEQEDIDPNLPEDPAEALAYLQERDEPESKP